jgi:hypothetical protein
MTITTKVSDTYSDKFTEIFGDKPLERGSWVYDKQLEKMVPKNEYRQPTQGDEYATVLKQLDPFISPIDGTMIDDRGKLREHNKKHGVTNVADYGEQYFERRQTEMHNETIGNTKEAKRERIETIKEAMHRHGLHN